MGEKSFGSNDRAQPNQPGDNSALSTGWEFGRDQTNQATATRPTDNATGAAGRVSDRTSAPARPGVLQLDYGDQSFDQKLSGINPPTLQINGLPKGVQINSWIDDKGAFFWYNNGADGRTHHYLPSNLKSIEVNGVKQDVDEMKIQASQAYLAEQDRGRIGFAAINKGTNPIEYAERMSAISDQALQLEEKTLREAAINSPNNPYFPIYLADTVVAQAFKPVLQQVTDGQNKVELNNPYTVGKIDEALQMLKYAEQIASKQGNLQGPNTEMMPGLYPFALNPHFHNPDMYWSGALYQAYQREVALTLLKTYMQHSGTLELP